MKKEFWIEKWNKNEIGFHKDIVHPLLQEHINKLGLEQGDTVFVPLCGKSLDMLWLTQSGFKVIGVELSDLAAKQFFNEHKIEYTQSLEGDFNVFRSENIVIYCGNVFDLTKAHLHSINAIYDRAALIALPENMARRYVEKILNTAPAYTKTLLITLELQRMTTDKLGPPFSVSDSRVEELYSELKSIQKIHEVDIIEREEGFQKLGCQYVYERAYVIE